MIEIHKIDEDELKMRLAAENNIEYSQTNEYFGVFDGTKVLEFVMYAIKDEILEISFISNISNDFSLIHGLLKTILFISDLKKVEAVSIPHNYERAAKALRFEDKDNQYILRLEDYQNTCESHTGEIK